MGEGEVGDGHAVGVGGDVGRVFGHAAAVPDAELGGGPREGHAGHEGVALADDEVFVRGAVLHEVLGGGLLVLGVFQQVAPGGLYGLPAGDGQGAGVGHAELAVGGQGEARAGVAYLALGHFPARAGLGLSDEGLAGAEHLDEALAGQQDAGGEVVVVVEGLPVRRVGLGVLGGGDGAGGGDALVVGAVVEDDVDVVLLVLVGRAALPLAPEPGHGALAARGGVGHGAVGHVDGELDIVALVGAGDGVVGVSHVGVTLWQAALAEEGERAAVLDDVAVNRRGAELGEALGYLVAVVGVVEVVGVT